MKIGIKAKMWTLAFLMWAIFFFSESSSLSLKCLTLFDSMDYTVHGILQARILEWVAVPFSRGFCQLRDPGLPHYRQILCQLSH